MSNLCRINVECMSKTTCDTTCGTLHVSICWASYEYLQNCNVGIVLALHQPTFPARKDVTTVPLADSALCTHGPNQIRMHPHHRTSAHAEGPPVRSQLAINISHGEYVIPRHLWQRCIDLRTDPLARPVHGVVLEDFNVLREADRHTVVQLHRGFAMPEL